MEETLSLLAEDRHRLDAYRAAPHRPEENDHAPSSKFALERTLALFERYVVQ
jgi:hypothetical protein